MVFRVGVAVFSRPSRMTPGMTRGVSRSRVRIERPRLVRKCSVALKMSPPRRMSNRIESEAFRYRKVFVRPTV